MIYSLKIFSVISVLFFVELFNPKVEHYTYKFQITGTKQLQVGEDLTYEVSYLFLKLGVVRTVVKSKKIFDGITYYDAVAYIDSYPGIPFVNLHQIYETMLLPDYFSKYFHGIVKYDNYSSYTNYYFNYKKSEIKIIKGRVFPPQIWTDSTTTANTEYQDGLSILFYTRMNTGKDTSVNLPCFVNEKKVYTHINFYKNVVPISIDAVNYKISSVKIDGTTNFISIFGLTGHFEGWFSNDDAAIPLLAKMKVIIGNVTLELKKWNRKGWIPPEYAKN